MESTVDKKVTHLVLKDCFKELRFDLKATVIDDLWSKNWISDEEKLEVQSSNSDIKRNEKLINILKTK